MTPVSVYLDTCVLSRILDVRLKEATALAYAEIVNSSVQLVASDKARTEVLKTANPARNSLLQFLVGLVQKVPLRTLHLSGAIGGFLLEQFLLEVPGPTPYLPNFSRFSTRTTLSISH